MKRIKTYNQYRESRPIKEEFIGKLWRNITGKNKQRIESIQKILDKFKDFTTPITIKEVDYVNLDEGDKDMVAEVVSEFNKIVENSSWRKEVVDSIDKNDYYFLKLEIVNILFNWIKGNLDFSKIEEMDDSSFRRNSSLDADEIERIKNLLRNRRRNLAKKFLKEALTNISNKDEFQNAKHKEGDLSEPETKLLKYYSDVFNYKDRDDEPKTNFDSGEDGLPQLMKSFVLFQKKPYKSYDYIKKRPQSYEEVFGKDYISKIDFTKKISELENLQTLKSELEDSIKWIKEKKIEEEKSEKSITKLRSLWKTFGDNFKEVGLDNFYRKKYDLNLPKIQTFLNFVNYIIENFGQMTISQFFNSEAGKGEKFTTSEDYFNDREVYKIKEGSNKVYHGGKISPTDLDFLFREQGGMYAGKLMTGANNWPIILGKKEGGLLSINLTRRVYELTIKPGTKAIDHNPGGSDSGSFGGLKDENKLYTPHGIMVMASKWYMQEPNGGVPENYEEITKNFKGGATKQEYIDSALESEVVVFDKSVCDIRIVPFKELISEYERLGSTDKNRNKIKDTYPQMRNLVWSIESQSPGVLSGLKEFTELTNLSAIDSAINKANRNDKAPDSQEVDDLVEKCGSISVRSDYIKKFPTLLDHIIYRFM